MLLCSLCRDDSEVDLDLRKSIVNLELEDATWKPEWMCWVRVLSLRECSSFVQSFHMDTCFLLLAAPLVWRSAAESCPTLCDPVDCSTPGLPVLQCPLEFAQIHIHEKDLFVYVWPCWAFAQDARAGSALCCGHGLLTVAAPLAVDLGWALGLHQWLGAPEHRPSGCGTWTQLPCDMWDLPGPGIEPMSCALQGVLLTTEPPRTSSRIFKKWLSLRLILSANMNNK